MENKPFGPPKKLLSEVKTVIEAAGLNKRKYPDQSEAQILLRALQDVNVGAPRP